MNTRFILSILGLFISPILLFSTITTGSEAIYDNDQSQTMAISNLDDTKFVICYSDGGASGSGTCKVGTRSGTSTSYGPSNTFTGANIYNVKVRHLSSTQFIVAFRNNSGGAKVRLGTVNGTSISYSTSASVTSVYVDNFGLTPLSSNTFAVAYKDNNNSGRGAVRIGTVSGGSISLGSIYYFNSGQTNHISIDALDSSTIAISYKDDANSNKGTSLIGSISGTAVTYHSESVFNTGNTEWINTIALSPTTFAVVYSDLGNGNKGTACIGSTNSSYSISFGSEYVFNSANTTNLVAAGHGANNFTMSFSDGGDGNNLNANVGTISGTSIAYGSEVTLNGNVQVPATAAIGLDYFVTIYKDDPNGGKSTAVAAYVPGVLPVELLYFEAKLYASNVALLWETGSESENRGFTIQRSPDAQSWTDIGFEAGAGSISYNKSYDWIDRSPLSGNNYYRLIQEDYDGTRTYTNIVHLNLGEDNAIKVYPNPLTTTCQLEWKGQVPVSLILYDLSGKKVQLFGGNSQVLDLSSLDAGVYILSVQFRAETKKIRLLKN